MGRPVFAGAIAFVSASLAAALLLVGVPITFVVTPLAVGAILSTITIIGNPGGGA